MTNTSLRIRTAEPSEGGSAGPVRDLLLVADEDPAMLDRSLGFADAELLVAQMEPVTAPADGAGPVPAGVALWAPITGDTAELLALATRPDLERRGIGGSLVRAVQSAVVARGLSWLELGTGNTPGSTLEFYQRLGFRLLRIRPDYFRIHYPQRLFDARIELRDRVDLRWSAAEPGYNTVLEAPQP